MREQTGRAHLPFTVDVTHQRLFRAGLHKPVGQEHGMEYACVRDGVRMRAHRQAGDVVSRFGRVAALCKGQDCTSASKPVTKLAAAPPPTG
jgi:hypothetical protein